MATRAQDLKAGRQEFSDHIDRVLAAEALGEHDELGFIQLADTAVLARIARGEIDLNALARRELANRGCDDSGEWVGFAAAQTRLEQTA